MPTPSSSPASVSIESHAPVRVTVGQKYCAVTGCAPEQARRQLFWRALYPHAAPVAPFLGGFAAPFFTPERELVEGILRARTSAQINEEIRDYFSHPWNCGWWRSRARIRISTHRLRRLASGYLDRE